jgi:hypothetical protein
VTKTSIAEREVVVDYKGIGGIAARRLVVETRGDGHRDDRGQRGGSVVAHLGFTGASAGTYTTAQAVRIAGRYRLDDRVSDVGQSTLWKAFDEVLGRPVAVRTFGTGFPHTAKVVAAARAASRVSDERLARVFDADAAPGGAYVVTEWPTGAFLDDLLAAGQLDIAVAVGIAADAAEALASAHAAGIPHLCLTPRSLIVNREAGVKIVGLGIDAALAGTELPSVEAARADTRGLACLLYAALTGYWPGEQPTMLPFAPHRDGRPYRPRQVRAGLPARLDAIACRALFEPLPGGRGHITSPSELADLLRAAPLREQPPAVHMAVQEDHADSLDLEPPTAVRPPAPARRRRRKRALAAGGVLGALFVIDSALIGISIMGASHPPPASPASAAAPRPTVSRPYHHAAQPLTPVSAQAFNPYDGYDENGGLSAGAIDGNPDTAWHTFWYTTPQFGNLKPGTGLLLDMGRRVTITKARILLGATYGADVQLRIGDDTSSLRDMAIAAKAKDAGGTVTLRPAAAHRGRYVLVWFTKLPPSADRGGVFQADVYEVTVRGY